MVVFETFKWRRGDSNYNDYEYSFCDYGVKNMNFFIIEQTFKRSIKMPCIYETKQSCYGFVCLFLSFFVFYPFSDEADIDNKISREIDVMLENIQKSL